ncbi:MAG: HDOD domain-containing protein [Sulfuriflexus sp.]|nr:HDOD domain-containing protein [Sulfuriflexus sp.]
MSNAIRKNITAQGLVEDINQLVSLPEICNELDKMMDGPNNSIQGMAKLICQDVNLSARLLKLANSSLYGFSGRVDSIPRAISIIGTTELLILIMATSTMMTFNKIPGKFFNMAGFWRHSVYCGVFAKHLARLCNVLHPERLFIAGLMHDLGLLAICNNYPDIANQIFSKLHKTETATNKTIYEIEHQLLGFDHAEVGRELAIKWHLPSYLQDTIYYHHHLEEAEKPVLDAAIIHIASEVTHAIETGAIDEFQQDISELAWSLTGLNKDDVDKLHDQALTEFEEMLGILLPAIAK